MDTVTSATCYMCNKIIQKLPCGFCGCEVARLAKTAKKNTIVAR